MKSGFVLIFGLITLLLSAGFALADARDDVIANAVRCSAVADPRIWLDCYYGAAQPMRAQLGLPPAPQSQVNLVPMRTPGAPDRFGPMATMAPPMPARSSQGAFSGILGGGSVINKMPAASFSFDKKGLLTVTLPNGEVWQQNSSDDSRAKWKGPASRYLVTIKAGALDSWNMTVSADSNQYKVHRTL